METLHGDFTVCSFYEILYVSSPMSFPWKAIWRVKAPQTLGECSFFVWTAAWSKILTCDNLVKSSYSMASWCYMCHCNGEAVDHLLEDVY